MDIHFTYQAEKEARVIVGQRERKILKTKQGKSTALCGEVDHANLSPVVQKSCWNVGGIEKLYSDQS